MEQAIENAFYIALLVAYIGFAIALAAVVIVWHVAAWAIGPESKN